MREMTASSFILLSRLELSGEPAPTPKGVFHQLIAAVRDRTRTRAAQAAERLRRLPSHLRRDIGLDHPEMPMISPTESFWRL